MAPCWSRVGRRGSTATLPRLVPQMASCPTGFLYFNTPSRRRRHIGVTAATVECKFKFTRTLDQQFGVTSQPVISSLTRTP